MKYFLWFLGALVLLAACKTSTEKQAGEDTLTFEDLSSLFPPLKLPYSYTPDSLHRKEPDSSALKIKMLSAFVPDSVLHQAFRKGEKIRYFPVGRLEGKQQALLLLKATSSRTMAAYLCAMDQKGKFLSALEVAETGSREPGHTLSMNIDDNWLVTLHDKQRTSPARVVTKEDVYTLDPNGSFTLILTNSSEPVSPDQISNPFDSLPRNNKYSGDYTAGDMNLVSIRDGRDAGTFRFFIHFSKDKGDCTGEINGTARFTNDHTGEYHEDNGPCGIRFTFSKTRVTLKEIGGCGAYRGIRCFFEGTFSKKKEGATDNK